MTNNSLAFVALCNEYCAAVEHCGEVEPHDFVARMIRLLPRIYISATDLDMAAAGYDSYIAPALDEDTYDTLRRSMERVLGENDTYLEVFEEDMQYSDTPIGASVAEGLADLFQVFFNMLEAIRDAPEDFVNEVLASVSEDFRTYWSRILCNVMRPLNSIIYKI